MNNFHRSFSKTIFVQFFILLFLSIPICLSAASIKSIVFDPLTGANKITLKPETPPEDYEVYYRVDFATGTYQTTNVSTPVAITKDVEVHHSPPMLGDVVYSAYHTFIKKGDPLPGYDDPAWIGPWIAMSPMAHDIKRGCFSDLEESSQLNMGPGWFVKYQLFEDAYVTAKIYRTTTTFITGYTDWGYAAGLTDTPIRTLVHKVPRSEQMAESDWWNTEEWDCRDENGELVENGMYTFIIDAYDKQWLTFDPSDTAPPTDDSNDPYPKTGRKGSCWVNVPVDILRLMRIQKDAQPITDYIGLNAITYRLTGASEVKIKIYNSTVKFKVHIDTIPGSSTYGEATPDYTSYDTAVTPSTDVLRTMTFYRSAGDWEEVWDGTKDDGTYLQSGVYKYAISAIYKQTTPDKDRIATNEWGNDLPIWGNITIFREEQSTSSDLASKITNITYDPVKGTNLIEYEEVESPEGYVTEYEIQYASGSISTDNVWATASLTTSNQAEHCLLVKGDYIYRVRHRFSSQTKGTTNWSPMVSSPVASNYIQFAEPITTDSTQQNWQIKYNLFAPSLVTIKIYPAGTTATAKSRMGFPTTYSASPVRTIINKAVRTAYQGSDTNSGTNIDYWDGRDDSGKLCANGIYVVAIDAYNFSIVFDQPVPPAPPDDSAYTEKNRVAHILGTIAVDAIRIINPYSSDVTSFNESDAIYYTLTHSADVTIKIYEKGVTFTGVDNNPASSTYGEAIPTAGYNALKTIKTYRMPGDIRELWDGTNSSNGFLPDGMYVFSISAINDGIVATNDTGDEHPIIGNITIIRGAQDPAANAGIESVSFDPDNKINKITLVNIAAPTGYTTQYEVQYASGNIYTKNNWESLGVSFVTDINHPVPILGDYIYRVRHRFYSGGNYTDWSAFPSTATYISFVHDVNIDSYSENDDEKMLGMDCWRIKYQIPEASFVTLKIYPSGTTVTSRTNMGFPFTYSNSPIKTIVTKVPRAGEQTGATWWNTEEWDGRNDAGTLMGNGIYMYSIDVYNKDNLAFDPSDVSRVSNYWGSIAADTLRIMKIQAEPITDYLGAGIFSYRLTGSAAVTLKIYQGGVTFTGVDTNQSSGTYGEPKPASGYTALKTLKFYRNAGNWTETWDGYDDSGKALDDGIYTYAISAVNGSIMAYGSANDGSPMYGNLTIMRLVPPESTDSSTGGSGSTTGSGSIVVGTYAPGRNRVVKENITAVIVSIKDGSNIDTTKSSMEVADPYGAVVKGQVLSAGNYVGMNIPAMTATGEYTVKMNLVATNGKYWDETYKFVLMKAGPLSKSAEIWNNPVKLGNPKIVVPLSAGDVANIKIFNIVGDLLKDENVSVSPYEWDISSVGNGIYFCRISLGNEKTIKKIMVAK